MRWQRNNKSLSQQSTAQKGMHCCQRNWSRRAEDFDTARTRALPGVTSLRLDFGRLVESLNLNRPATGLMRIVADPRTTHLRASLGSPSDLARHGCSHAILAGAKECHRPLPPTTLTYVQLALFRDACSLGPSA